jgi:predicted flap endonuclease-1-like 5' DNA nuclease
MANKPQAHPSFSSEEYVVASIAGLGLFLAILAGLFDAFGASSTLFGLSFTNLFWIGMVFIGLGLILWLVRMQPWKQFDDLQTGYFTEEDAAHYHSHHAHDDHAHPAAPAEHHEVAEDEADDLEIIEGLGPQAKAALIAAGLARFGQIAASEPAQLQSALSAAKLPAIVKADSWPRQAQYILDGDTVGFEAYKASLKGGTVENLQQIEGIGPKVEAALHAAGITSYAQLAAAPVDTLRQIMQNNNLKLAKPDTWPRQAQYIVEGDVAGLKAYQAALVGGVEKP